MASQLSFESVLSKVQAFVQVPPAARANGLASLVKQVHDTCDTSSELRVLVQDTFCQALLKTLQPTKAAAALLTASTNGPSTPHPSHPKPASRSQQQPASSSLATAAFDPDLAWTAASSALELIYSWEDEQVVVSVINFWGQISSLLSGSWLHQVQPEQLSNSQRTPPSPSSLLQANPSATTTAAAAEDPSGHPTNPTNPSTTAAATCPRSANTPEVQYLTWLWSLGPAAVAAVVQQLHQFWHLTGINHLQHKHTQQQHNKGPAHHLINLLLLFLDLHSSSGHNSSSSSCQAAVQLLQLLYGGTASRPGTVAAATTAGEAFAGVCCLLQAVAALHITLPAPATPAAAAAVRGDQEAAADRKTRSPLQAAAVAAAAADPANSQLDNINPSAVTAWPLLAEASGKWLRDCYGWCWFGEAANASPAAAAAAAEAARHSAAGFSSSSASNVARPSTVESLYDCFMMLLLQQMMQGPAAVVSSSSIDTNFTTLGRTATGRQAGSQAAAAAAAAAGNSASDNTGSTAAVLSEDDWKGWLDSEAFGALAALVATYDRPDVLARGLHMLTQQQLQAAENAVAAAAAAADGAEAAAGAAGTQGLSSKSMQAAAKKAEKAAMGRALQLLERVYLWRQQQQALKAVLPDSSSSGDSAAAGGVCQLLLGLSELLRPAANCSVEWRCTALTAMLSAVEGFMQEHPDGSDLELQLWCDASVEGLLYCASHDPSIQARRAAVQLLQHVVLPNSSSTTKALIRCLADKLSDKDNGVAAAALQLFVQLPPKVLCNSLTAAQWCAAVQACLEMVCGSGGSADTATQGGRGARGSQAQGRGAGAAARQHFAELVKTVLLSEARSDGQCQQQQQQQMYGWQWLMSQGGRVVGIEGCKQVLLMLMMEPGLGDSWEALAQGV